MSWFPNNDRRLAELLVNIIFANPFLPERQELNRAILGKAFVRGRKIRISFQHGLEHSENLHHLVALCRKLTDKYRKKLSSGNHPQSPEEKYLYEHLVYFLIYHELAPLMDRYIVQSSQHPQKQLPWKEFKEVQAYCRHYLGPLGTPFKPTYSEAQLTAFLFQIRRAFYNTFTKLIGNTPALNRLRGRVWESIFTHDMRRYLRSLYRRMHEVHTLITGPSGSGKEAVAGSIGLSRYIPFDPGSQCFESHFLESYHPINLSALNSTLIESELFGHRRGAFTGALEDKAGYFESCGPYGTVLLDEIGDTDKTIQIKLLRVLQTRGFQRLGDTRPRQFAGKIMAATNVDLPKAIAEGQFREDFYYRLCSDRINTPALKEILHGQDHEIENMVRYIAEKFSDSHEADSLTNESMEWISKQMPPNYDWPGNFRELEQCVRNVMVHGEYYPHQQNTAPSENLPNWLHNSLNGRLSLNELCAAYIHQEYQRSPQLAEVGLRLKIDPRTVRKYLNHPTPS